MIITVEKMEKKIAPKGEALREKARDSGGEVLICNVPLCICCWEVRICCPAVQVCASLKNHECKYARVIIYKKDCGEDEVAGGEERMCLNSNNRGIHRTCYEMVRVKYIGHSVAVRNFLKSETSEVSNFSVGGCSVPTYPLESVGQLS
jgi:hypothetical protein